MEDHGEAVTTYKTQAEFAAAIQKYADKRVQLIAKNVAAEAFRTVAQLVVEATPVLTGHARANWIPSADEPDGSINPGVAGVDVTGQPQTSAEKQDVEAVIKHFLSNDDSTTLYLNNNLNYIQALDDGDSRKAPAGIVLPSITAALSVIKDRGTR